VAGEEQADDATDEQQADVEGSMAPALPIEPAATCAVRA